MTKLGTFMLAIFIMLAPILANAQEVEQAVAQAKQDAKTDVNGCTWFGAGFIFSVLGLAASFSMVPSPKPDRLMGKSPEYIEAYSTAYKEKLRSNQAGYAAAGCAMSGLGILIIIGSISSASVWGQL